MPRVRFGVRALMLALALMAVALGRWVASARAQARAVAAVRTAGGEVLLEPQDSPRRLRPPAWLVRLLGQDYFFEARAVDVPRGARWDDRAARALRDLPALTRLTVDGSPMTDDAMDAVASLTQLRQLMLWSTAITDRGVRRLRACRRLEWLALGGGGIRGDALADLAGLPRLRFLDVTACPLGDDGVNALGRFDGLESLAFRHTGLDCRGRCHPIHAWRRLRELRVTGALFDDKDLNTLGTLAALEVLDLGYTNFGDRGLERLGGLSGLKELDVSNTAVSDAGVAGVRARLPSLRVTGAPVPAREPEVGSPFDLPGGSGEADKPLPNRASSDL